MLRRTRHEAPGRQHAGRTVRSACRPVMPCPTLAPWPCASLIVLISAGELGAVAWTRGAAWAALDGREGLGMAAAQAEQPGSAGAGSPHAEGVAWLGPPTRQEDGKTLFAGFAAEGLQYALGERWRLAKHAKPPPWVDLGRQPGDAAPPTKQA